MDREAYATWRRGRPSANARRRLAQTVARYDPSWLPRVADPAHPLINDPVTLAVDIARRQAAAHTPLPADLLRADQAMAAPRAER